MSLYHPVDTTMAEAAVCEMFLYEGYRDYRDKQGESTREHVSGLPATPYRPRATPGRITYRADMLCAHCGHTWHQTLTP